MVRRRRIKHNGFRKMKSIQHRGGGNFTLTQKRTRKGTIIWTLKALEGKSYRFQNQRGISDEKESEEKGRNDSKENRDRTILRLSF
jgi:hypothetical protein